MAQNPGNQMQLGGGPRRSPESFAAMVASYVIAFVRVVFWGIVASAACGAAYVAARGIWVLCGIALKSLGV